MAAQAGQARDPTMEEIIAYRDDVRLIYYHDPQLKDYMEDTMRQKKL